MPCKKMSKDVSIPTFTIQYLMESGQGLTSNYGIGKVAADRNDGFTFQKRDGIIGIALVRKQVINFLAKIGDKL
ncbi:hypothetical protein D3Z62_03555 [Lachnospiraceae bacterium]|nr:hypothetical protein [Lachnospiraceae bacterium]